MSFSKIHPVALGLSFGVISGISALLMCLAAYSFFNDKPIVAAVGTMYISYNPSLINSALGGVAGFVNAFIAGYVAAWIYNLLLDRI